MGWKNGLQVKNRMYSLLSLGQSTFIDIFFQSQFIIQAYYAKSNMTYLSIRATDKLYPPKNGCQCSLRWLYLNFRSIDESCLNAWKIKSFYTKLY